MYQCVGGACECVRGWRCLTIVSSANSRTSRIQRHDHVRNRNPEKNLVIQPIMRRCVTMYVMLPFIMSIMPEGLVMGLAGGLPFTCNSQM